MEFMVGYEMSAIALDQTSHHRQYISQELRNTAALHSCFYINPRD